MLLPILLTLGVVAIIGLIVFLIISPVKAQHKVFAANSNLDPSLNTLMRMFGGDITSLIGDTQLSKITKKSNLTELFKRSGNPWKIAPMEFVILQFILGGVGIFIGLLSMSILYALGFRIIAFISLPTIVFVLFNYPRSYYKSIAKEREAQFKAQLPEAIDYLTLALSGGGYSLPIAFEETLKYMPNNLMRKEIERIVNDLHSGLTMETTLNSFADRSPTEGIRAFAKSLNNANKLSIGIVIM